MIKVSNAERVFMLDRPDETRSGDAPAKLRRLVVLDTARQLGLLDGEKGRIGARIRKGLLAAARKRSGIESDTALLEYPLAKVALEDDFGAKLMRRKGRIAKDIDLEF